jgi:hypothetical protein
VPTSHLKLFLHGDEPSTLNEMHLYLTRSHLKSSYCTVIRKLPSQITLNKYLSDCTGSRSDSNIVPKQLEQFVEMPQILQFPDVLWFVRLGYDIFHKT